MKRAPNGGGIGMRLIGERGAQGRRTERRDPCNQRGGRGIGGIERGGRDARFAAARRLGTRPADDGSALTSFRTSQRTWLCDECMRVCLCQHT